MHQPHRPTIDESVTASLRTLSGANTRASTITAYRTDLAQFAHFLSETTCTIASPADVPWVAVAEYLAHLSDRDTSGTTRARKLAAIRDLAASPSLRSGSPVVGIVDVAIAPHELHEAQHCASGTQPPLPPMTGTSFKQQTSP